MKQPAGLGIPSVGQCGTERYGAYIFVVGNNGIDTSQQLRISGCEKRYHPNNTPQGVMIP